MAKNKIIFIIVIIAVAGLVIGFLAGRQQGVNQSEEKLMPLIDLVYPGPSDEIHSFRGTVQNIYGADIKLEINDPDDYLPHLDKSPRRKEIRTVRTSFTTEFILIDPNQFDEKGNSITTTISLADIKVGDIITVRSDQNIKDLQKFSAVRITVTKNN